MSSYVPPHLRKPLAATTTTTVTTTDDVITTNHNKLSSNNNTNTTFSARRSSTNNNGTQPSRTSLDVPNVVVTQWKPSERVLRLKPEQIEEVRLRLNVDVTCLNSSIMKDIAIHEYTTPTSIQAQAMPVALSGRDLLGCAETGSGKTAAFTIPMIQHCIAQSPVRRGDGPLALVLAPTRELAQQIEKEVKAFSQSLESFRTAIVVGGTNISDQRSELRSGIEIVVATPGRFIDHLQQGNTSLTRISYVVLDEADRMLDMGFEPQIREVMHNLPEKHQTLLFSATMPVEIEALAQEYLTNPVQVKVGKVSSPTENVSQNLEKITENEKIDRLLSLLVEEAATAKNLGHPFPLTIVFVERKTRCDEVAGALVDEGLNAVALHGGRTQSEREGALRDFRHGPTNILVATDVASRGLDVTGVAHVVNLDLPKGLFLTIGNFQFLVSQIRKAIADVQSGNTVAFATGKVARRKEKEAAAAEKEARIAQAKLPPTSINVEDKYKYMIAPAMIKKEGSADDAWDD
ncbi:DEAD-box ATP-dependent RNA helicase 20-like protein [Tanacetum coccineum]